MFGLSVKFRASRCVFTIVNRCFGGELENKYSELQKEKILKVMNDDVSLLSRCLWVNKPFLAEMRNAVSTYAAGFNPTALCESTISGRHRPFLKIIPNPTRLPKYLLGKVLRDSSPRRYEITKARLKNFTTWVQKNGQIKNLSDIKAIDGFTKKNSEKLFDSIINGPPKNVQNLSKKIKGQVLHPHLSETLRQNCKSVLAVYITVNSVCWTLIDKANYEVLEWRYHGIDYPDSKKMQITNILDIAWDITNQLPTADIYVMKAEATSLRAAGSDPNNPKVLGVNLQKAQLIAMIVALINAKNSFYVDGANEESSEKLEFKQKVYFLRPSLPFRLYGTLVGNERVSTDQTVETLLQEVKNRESNSQVYVPDKLVTMFRNQKDLQKDMLGQCLLLALTFMDVCVYLNKDSINKLLKRGE